MNAGERRPPGDFRHGGLEASPFGDDVFDLVTGFDAFRFTGSAAAEPREAGRVTRPGGAVVIMTWGDPAGMQAARLIAALKPRLPPAPPAPSPRSRRRRSAVSPPLAWPSVPSSVSARSRSPQRSALSRLRSTSRTVAPAPVHAAAAWLPRHDRPQARGHATAQRPAGAAWGRGWRVPCCGRALVRSGGPDAATASRS